ncbi:hypothetical protein HDV01_001612 [Terramyces sp. JEL0728]|nr:hypothetical protein HDV01_001612 [Terramyces sp. JEL0728]
MTKLTGITYQELLQTANDAVPKDVPKGQFFDQVNQAVQLMNLVHPLESWTVNSSSKGVEISKLAITNLDHQFFRGDLLVENRSLYEFLSILTTMGVRPKWDGRYDGGKMLKRISNSASVILSAQKGQMFVAGREFATANHIQYVDENTVDMIITSVEDEMIPPVAKGKVRGHILLNGWRIEKKGNDLQVAYVCHVDPKGIPVAIFSMVQGETAMQVLAVADYFKKHNSQPVILKHPEYAIGSDVVLKGQDLGTEKKVALEYSVGQSGEAKKGRVCLALPSAFKNGFEIKANQCVKAALIAENDLWKNMQAVELWVESDPVDIVVEITPAKEFLLNGNKI